MSEPYPEETTLVPRLKSGLAQGHHEDVEHLLRLHPELQARHFCIQVALYDIDRVKCALEQDPALAITPDGPRRPILHLPGKLEHVRRLVALGLPYDAPDVEGLTPVQVAGWEGLPEVLEYFLSLKPDLEHVNGYGGTLLTTILHGSENNPARKDRDYIACLRAVLHLGVALPREAMETAAVKEVRAFLEDWAQAKPSQLV